MIDIDDAIAMDEALEEWGGYQDPHAAEFRRGWRDERGRRNSPPAGMAARCAYHSGMIAARQA